jgi:hypothetical protein
VGNRALFALQPLLLGCFFDRLLGEVDGKSPAESAPDFSTLFI